MSNSNNIVTVQTIDSQGWFTKSFWCSCSENDWIMIKGFYNIFNRPKK